MKHSMLLFAFFILTGFTQLLTAGDYAFATKIDINEVAINRFLAKQFNDTSFTKSWSNTYDGNVYSLSIERPVVILQSNSIKLEIGVTLNNNYYLLSPSLTVSPVTITSADIKATFIELQTYLNTFQRITNQWEKDLINQKLYAIQWVIYKGMLLSESASVTDYAVVTTTIESIETKFESGAIKLNFYFKNHTERPGYLILVYTTTEHKTFVWIQSNTLIVPIEFYLFTSSGGVISHVTDFSDKNLNSWINTNYPYKYNVGFTINGEFNLFGTIAQYYLKRGDGVVGIEASGHNPVYATYSTYTTKFGE